ncbi:hypothetical protein COLO4_15663 [Corchorus olitorius]|uniref:Endonuclease/exonuclease/phosphatase n=1 Tax=Corchorus olitorius TaxID=93759 RepID=A0A1R3JLW7_9ROSI|nr:hypothetical protein COLO4_15663 [Corchorus olitorius]
MAASPQSEQLPVLGDMSPVCQSLNHVIEEQLGVTYSDDVVFDDCAEFKKTPKFLELVKVLIAFTEGFRSCCLSGSGTHGLVCTTIREVVGEWLGSDDMLLGDTADGLSMLDHHHVFKELYVRGLAHHIPPQICLQTLKDPERVFLEDDKYNVTLYGDHQRLILVTTKPCFKVAIKQEYVVDLSYGVATHKINLRLCSHETCGLCGHVSYFPLNPPISQPFVILIYNVVGAANLGCRRRSVELLGAYHPHLMVITEIRISRVRAKDNMKSFGYCHGHQLDPFGYFGGQWLLWNSSDVDLDVTMKKMCMLESVVYHPSVEISRSSTTVN